MVITRALVREMRPWLPSSICLVGTATASRGDAIAVAIVGVRAVAPAADAGSCSMPPVGLIRLLWVAVGMIRATSSRDTPSIAASASRNDVAEKAAMFAGLSANAICTPELAPGGSDGG